VFVSASSVQAGILVGENAVRIFAEGQALGRLTADVNGAVTSLPVNLYTRVLPGMDMKVINALTGDVYAVTAENGPWGAGEVMIDIEEQLVYARAGDALIGDNSFQQSQITVTQGLIVLKVNTNGRVAQIRLGADGLGSEIDISAEQVNINGIVFTEGTVSPAVPGDIKTSNYTAGSAGWKIDGDGSAEFNDVTVRGTVIGGTGATRYELDPSTGVTIGDVSVYGSTLKANELTLETLVGSDANNPKVIIKGDRLILSYGNMLFDYEATDANNGYFKVTAAEINFANLPTSDTGLAVGDLWRDSNTVKVKT